MWTEGGVSFCRFQQQGSCVTLLLSSYFCMCLNVGTRGVLRSWDLIALKSTEKHWNGLTQNGRLKQDYVGSTPGLWRAYEGFMWDSCWIRSPCSCFCRVYGDGHVNMWMHLLAMIRFNCTAKYLNYMTLHRTSFLLIVVEHSLPSANCHISFPAGILWHRKNASDFSGN